MIASINGTMLWLTGWSMPNTVFDRLRELLPEFHHVVIDYSDAESLEKMLQLTEAAALSTCKTLAYRGPLLISGWSLGGLLAMRLAAKGFANGLVLFAATARFTRSNEEKDRGWPDAYVRQMMKGVIKEPHEVETKFRKMMFTEAEWEAGLGNSLPHIGSWTTPALIAGLQILRSEEVLSELPKMECPVFLVHGMEDQICPYTAAQELAARLPQARLLSIPDCGHAPFLGRENEIAEELRRWLDEQ